jgi:hypothetical protein
MDMRSLPHYPPPPWRLLGQSWAGLFRATRPLDLPAGLRHMLPPRWLFVGLARYREGTLRYDEFFTASVARSGAKIGLYVQQIWVSDARSQAGGRGIWGLPKELATFTWHDGGVRMCDSAGMIAAISVTCAPRTLPPLPMRGAGIGRSAATPLFFDIALWGCVGRATMRIDACRLPLRMNARPLFSLAMNPFRATFHAPQPTRAAERSRQR